MQKIVRFILTLTLLLVWDVGYCQHLESKMSDSYQCRANQLPHSNFVHFSKAKMPNIQDSTSLKRASKDHHCVFCEAWCGANSMVSVSLSLVYLESPVFSSVSKYSFAFLDNPFHPPKL